MGSTAKGQANGLASLGATGRLPAGQAPQAVAVASVATANADATYGQPEADLINELKAQVNALLAALRTAGTLAP